MKEIIRHVFYKTQCQFCGTEFAFEKSDCHVRPTAGNKKILPFTECPNCGKETPATADKSTQITMQPATENANVSHIAKMQQQIDTFKAALLHINERINNGNLVYTEPLDDNDKHIINNIIRFIDEHATENHTEQHPDTNHEPQRQETTVFDIFPQIKQSNAINIVVTTPIDDFTPNPEAELNEDDLDDFAKILAKNRKCGYVTVFPTNKDNPFRKIFIEPNLNEKGFLRQDRFATELTTQNGVKYMLFFPWSKINNQNAPYNEK